MNRDRKIGIYIYTYIHWTSLASGQFLSVSLFVYLVVINGQIRDVLCKCKSAGGEIKHFYLILPFGPHTPSSYQNKNCYSSHSVNPERIRSRVLAGASA